MARRYLSGAFCCLFFLTAALAARADDHAMSLDEFMAAVGWDFDKAEIKTEKVSDRFYVLFGIGGNIGVSIGEHGVLLVDDQFPQMMPRIEQAIRKLGGKGVDFVVNTHWHFDHAEGNITLGERGAWIVSQANARKMMLEDQVINLVGIKYGQKAYPESALPVITFDDRMQFHFNGERIELLHTGPAHTTGDAAVIFRGSNVVHMGDVFNRAGYPFIDADNGGDVAGMIAFCRAVLAAIDKETTVVPGHGEISDYEGLQSYTDMLATVHQRIAKLVKRGKSLQEVVAEKPTREFDEQYGDPARFVDRAYVSIKRELGDGEPGEDPDDGDERGGGQLLDLLR